MNISHSERRTQHACLLVAGDARFASNSVATSPKPCPQYQRCSLWNLVDLYHRERAAGSSADGPTPSSRGITRKGSWRWKETRPRLNSVRDPRTRSRKEKETPYTKSDVSPQTACLSITQAILLQESARLYWTFIQDNHVPKTLA